MKKILIFTPVLSLFVSCASDIPMVNLGIDDTYYIARMSKLPLESALTGNSYRWTVNGNTVSSERNYLFLAEDEGVYKVVFNQ